MREPRIVPSGILQKSADSAGDSRCDCGDGLGPSGPVPIMEGGTWSAGRGGSFVAIIVQFGEKTAPEGVGNRPKMVTFVQLTHRL